MVLNELDQVHTLPGKLLDGLPGTGPRIHLHSHVLATPRVHVPPPVHPSADRHRRMPAGSREHRSGCKDARPPEPTVADPLAHPTDRGPEIPRRHDGRDTGLQVVSQKRRQVVTDIAAEGVLAPGDGGHVPDEKVDVGVEQAGEHGLSAGIDPAGARGRHRPAGDREDSISRDDNGAPLEHGTVPDNHPSILHDEGRLLTGRGKRHDREKA